MFTIVRAQYPVYWPLFICLYMDGAACMYEFARWKSEGQNVVLLKWVQVMDQCFGFFGFLIIQDLTTIGHSFVSLDSTSLWFAVTWVFFTDSEWSSMRMNRVTNHYKHYKVCVWSRQEAVRKNNIWRCCLRPLAVSQIPPPASVFLAIS